MRPSGTTGPPNQPLPTLWLIPAYTICQPSCTCWQWDQQLFQSHSPTWSPQNTQRVPPAHSSVPHCYGWVRRLGLGCQCSAAQVETQVRAGHYPRCSVPTSHQHAAVPSQHPCCNIAWEKSNPTVLAITFRHITFGRTAWVFAILTRPLHTQGAKNTESVDQPSYREKQRGQCPL